IVIVVWVLGWNASAQIQVMTPWWTAIGTTDTTELGLSVAGIGDINLDGFDDFAVGTEEKRVWIFLGSAEPDSIPDMFINPHDSIDHKFGEKLSNLGDINGDGEPDLAVYCRYAIGDPATMYSIYFAGAAFDTIPDLLLGKVYIGEDFIVGIGDFNGDGGNDFALGDYTFSNPGQYNDGVMQVFFGGTILDSIPDWQNLTEPPDGYFPKYCTGLGDLNGDGCDEFAVCSPSVKDTIFSEVIGLVEVYYGSSTPDTIPDFRFYGSEDGSDVLGSSIAALDVNGDGYKEMLVRSDRDFPPDYFYSYLIYDLVPEPDSIPDYFLGGQLCMLWGTNQPSSISMEMVGTIWRPVFHRPSQAPVRCMSISLETNSMNQSICLCTGTITTAAWGGHLPTSVTSMTMALRISQWVNLAFSPLFTSLNGVGFTSCWAIRLTISQWEFKKPVTRFPHLKSC
ncbi:MAG: integrin alpha, partial [bacterium]